MTAVPKAPPIARAEKARPVAVERNAWGAVNWTHATSSVRGPAQPIPVSAVKMIWLVPQPGLMKAKQMDAMNMMAKVTARGDSRWMVNEAIKRVECDILRSLYLVAHHVTAKEVNMEAILKDNCRIAMFQALSSKPTLRMS